jgi:hypothetical protein
VVSRREPCVAFEFAGSAGAFARLGWPTLNPGVTFMDEKLKDQSKKGEKSSSDPLDISNLPDKDAEQAEKVKGGAAGGGCNTNTVTCPPSSICFQTQ